MKQDLMNARASLQIGSSSYIYYDLKTLFGDNLDLLDRLPFSIRIMLEGLLRHCNGREVTQIDVQSLAGWKPVESNRKALQFIPGRVVLQDFTGVPVIVDLASMREAMKKMGGDPARINPTVPVDLVIDHSVQVDYFGTLEAYKQNAAIEFERNHERYELLHWAQKAFKNLRVVPPATGIVHQVNLEFLANLILKQDIDGETLLFPDTLVGTDSHTTMINGLGVVGWGVGGIEAIAAMLSQPIEMLTPDVIGFKLTGSMKEGVTPTDVTLTITQMLRKKKVVEKFVEFYGNGLDSLSLSDRAMIANMSPENGATLTYFPVDDLTLHFLRMTGRPEDLIAEVETYYKSQRLFRESNTPDPQFSDTLELDLGTVEPSLAGPRRPQDRLSLGEVKQTFEQVLPKGKTDGGFAISENALHKSVVVEMNGERDTISHGAVVIASITSCTNTSNPSVMVAAGLLAKKAVEKGLTVRPYVKTSLAPGSRVVTDYLSRAGLIEPLSKLGFSLVGYGCMTCIGNSGPLPEPVSDAIQQGGLVTAAVLSGNRNFEGRVHPQVQANFLASPPLVVAYALAGKVNLDLTKEPLGIGENGQPVYLNEIWPSTEEIQAVIDQNISADMYRRNYANVFDANETWNAIESKESELYTWKENSTYVQEPPYFNHLGAEIKPASDIHSARVLALLGDSITTDHISPAGNIPKNGPAGEYLLSKGVSAVDFNSFGSRRGNDRVMARGTFANIRLKNLLVAGVEGGFTLHFPDEKQMTIFDAAVKYQEDSIPTIILAGKEYGTGSSRDWAAKGPLLLGVRAVIAESFERIHRTNLVGMGILPLQFLPGDSAAKFGLDGSELYDIEGISSGLQVGKQLMIHVTQKDGTKKSIQVIVRLNTEIELEYYQNGGIMQTVLLNMLQCK